MIPRNPQEAKKIFDQIFLKNKNGQQLSLDEEEMFGLLILKEIKDIHKLDEKKFPNYKFRHLYLIYYTDLTFIGNYFKPNFNVKSSEIFDYKIMQEINRRKFDQNTFNKIQNLRRAFDVETPVDKKEIQIDKKYLEKIANDWAQEMLRENHTDQNLVLLSKETRDTIRKKNIENYLNDILSGDEKIDVFKALLKSKHTHIEAAKILQRIGKPEIIFKLDGVNVHYNYGSIIHIFNRHFAPLASNTKISESKTFHSPEISPYKLHHTLVHIFQKINAKKALQGLVKPGVPIFLKYKNENYSLYLKTDNLNKSKLNINTFYQIDENTEYGKNDMVKIKRSSYIPLSCNLGIYKNFS